MKILMLNTPVQQTVPARLVTQLTWGSCYIPCKPGSCFYLPHSTGVCLKTGRNSLRKTNTPFKPPQETVPTRKWGEAHHCHITYPFFNPQGQCVFPFGAAKPLPSSWFPTTPTPRRRHQDPIQKGSQTPHTPKKTEPRPIQRKATPPLLPTPPKKTVPDRQTCPPPPRPPLTPPPPPTARERSFWRMAASSPLISASMRCMALFTAAEASRAAAPPLCCTAEHISPKRRLCTVSWVGRRAKGEGREGKGGGEKTGGRNKTLYKSEG